jgi:hypothetical protein
LSTSFSTPSATSPRRTSRSRASPTRRSTSSQAAASLSRLKFLTSAAYRLASATSYFMRTGAAGASMSTTPRRSVRLRATSAAKLAGCAIGRSPSPMSGRRSSTSWLGSRG